MKLSVITATYNAVEHLPKLIESLRNQEDKDFEWVVADGASTDGTLELLQSIKDLNIKISSQEDFGIYDALNRAIKVSSGEFYLVVGADDLLYPNAVKDYKNAIDNNVDVITAKIKRGDKISVAGKRPIWLAGMFGIVSDHAVGSCYRRNLHKMHGYYTRKLPISADEFFILKISMHGVLVKKINKLVGERILVGVSSVEILGTALESYRAKIMAGENKFMQTLLFIIRLARIYRKLN